MFVTIAAIATFSAQFIFLFNFVHSIFKGRKAPANPWKSNTLEWTTPRRPEHGNWIGPIPKVFRWSYDYGKPVKPEYWDKLTDEEKVNFPDFIPQNVPLTHTSETNFPHEDDLAAKEELDGMVISKVKPEEISET